MLYVNTDVETREMEYDRSTNIYLKKIERKNTVSVYKRNLALLERWWDKV